MQTIKGRGRNRNYLQVAAVPTMMKSLASVLLELLSQMTNPLCALFSDSHQSTTKSPQKNTNPFSLLCPQLHNRYNKFLPALTCWSGCISSPVANIWKPEFQNAGLQFSLSKTRAESWSNKGYFLVRFQLSTHGAFSSFCNQKRYISFTVLGLWSCW